jgi:hypothetical protein
LEADHPVTDSDSSSVSSSENLSPKGAKFEEERTYSSKASRNVSPASEIMTQSGQQDS